MFRREDVFDEIPLWFCNNELGERIFIFPAVGIFNPEEGSTDRVDHITESNNKLGDFIWDWAKEIYNGLEVDPTFMDISKENCEDVDEAFEILQRRFGFIVAPKRSIGLLNLFISNEIGYNPLSLDFRFIIIEYKGSLSNRRFNQIMTQGIIDSLIVNYFMVIQALGLFFRDRAKNYIKEEGDEDFKDVKDVYKSIYETMFGEESMKRVVEWYKDTDTILHEITDRERFDSNKIQHINITPFIDKVQNSSPGYLDGLRWYQFIQMLNVNGDLFDDDVSRAIEMLSENMYKITASSEFDFKDVDSIIKKNRGKYEQ